MERESFEDEEVARYLGEHFVAIKVDREERPDIDHIYMSVCQAMTGQGGWPLTVVMTPDKKPFFAGTYFPKRRQYGRLGLLELLERLVQVWTTDRAKAEEAGEQIARQLQGEILSAEDAKLSERDIGGPSLALCDQAVLQYRKEYDGNFGGFGSAPKFPSPHNLSFLLRQAQMTHDPSIAEMALHTLRCMYQGGLWDHVGFGFARYATDEQWLVPHFEKMLYDNALLAHAYLDAYAYTGDHFFAQVAEDIFTYVQREMTSPEGGFYSAQDADSEGEEGKFYLFTPEEINAVLGEEDGTWFASLFGVRSSGNFEGKNILNLLARTSDDFWPFSDLSDPAVQRNVDRLRRCRDLVYVARSKRVAPHKDDKILTSWNALMISALAKGYRLLGKDSYLDEAKRALSFIDKSLTRVDGRLLARYRDGDAKYLGYLEDYAYLGFALLEMYDATYSPLYLLQVGKLAQAVQELFADERAGGYYYYGSDAEALLARPKEYYDGAMPSGNSVWAHVLSRLAVITDDETITRWRDRQVAVCYKVAQGYPTAFAHCLMALQVALSPPVTVVLACRSAIDDRLWELVHSARSHASPVAAIMVRTDEWSEALAQVAPFTSQQVPLQGEGATAYVCVDFACRRPVHTTAELIGALELTRATSAENHREGPT